MNQKQIKKFNDIAIAIIKKKVARAREGIMEEFVLNVNAQGWGPKGWRLFLDNVFTFKFFNELMLQRMSNQK